MPARERREPLPTPLSAGEAQVIECDGEWGYEDPIYRFYHQSFKVYALGNTTKRIVSARQALAPEQPLNEWFLRIVAEGTDKTFDHEHNARWLEVTRPIV